MFMTGVLCTVCGAQVYLKLRITDKGAVSEMRIGYILFIESDLKW